MHSTQWSLPSVLQMKRWPHRKTGTTEPPESWSDSIKPGACTSQGTACLLNPASTCTHNGQAPNRLKGSSTSNATLKTSCFFLQNNSMPTLKMVKIKLTSWGRLHIPKYKVFLYFNKVEGDQVGPAGVFAGCGEGHTAGRKLRGWRHGPEGPRGRQGVRGGAITHKRRQMMSDQLCAQISPCTQPESQRMWRKKF